MPGLQKLLLQRGNLRIHVHQYRSNRVLLQFFRNGQSDLCNIGLADAQDFSSDSEEPKLCLDSTCLKTVTAVNVLKTVVFRLGNNGVKTGDEWHLGRIHDDNVF